MAKSKKDAKAPKADKADKAGKKGKGKKGPAGPKKSRIPQPVHGRAVSWAGLLALGFIALLMLNGTLTLQAAAIRAGIVVVALMLIERVVAPIIWMIMSNEGRDDDQSPSGEDADSTPEHTGA